MMQLSDNKRHKLYWFEEGIRSMQW